MAPPFFFTLGLLKKAISGVLATTGGGCGIKQTAFVLTYCVYAPRAQHKGAAPLRTDTEPNTGAAIGERL